MTHRLLNLSRALCLVACLAAGTAANAQSDVQQSPPSAKAAREANLVEDGSRAPLPGGSFSGYCTYRYAGNHVNVICYDYRINSNSRVFVELSEYSVNGPVTGRFMGSARMNVHNVVPFNGGVQVWTDVEWGAALNVRMDLLVDP